MSEMTPDQSPHATVDGDEAASDQSGGARQERSQERSSEASTAKNPPENPNGDRISGSNDERADGDWDEEDSILTWKLLVAVAVVLGVVFVGAFLFFNGNKKKDTNATPEGTGPSSSAAAQLPSIRDSFDRPDNRELGKTSTGEDWQAAIGIWGVRNKQAAVVEENANGPRNVAVLDAGSGDGSVSAKAAKLVDGWGLAYRYRGANAYWFIQWNDQYKAFHVFKVQDGAVKEVVKGGVAIPNSKDGMMVKIEYSGDTTTLFVEGKPVETWRDPFLKDQTKVGLYVSEKGAATARWSEFGSQKGLSGPPLTAAPDPKDKASPQSTQAKGSANQGQGGQAPKGGGGATSTTK